MEIIERVLGPDGVSTKYLQRTEDGFVVEATYIRKPTKHTLCVSTQKTNEAHALCFNASGMSTSLHILRIRSSYGRGTISEIAFER